MAWAIGTQPVPEHFEGAMIQKLKQLDYIQHPE
jgi:antitoxin CptB